MKKHHTLPLAAFAAACLAAPAFGQITIVNPGFESPNVGLTDISSNGVTVTDWTSPGVNRRWVVGEDWTGTGSTLIPSASSGDQSLLLGSNSNLLREIYQSIGTVAANTDYSFSFEIGKRNDTDVPSTVRVGLWGDTTGNNEPDTALIELGLSDFGTIPDGTTGNTAMKVISSSIVSSSTFDANAIGNDLFFYISIQEPQNTPQTQILFDNVAAVPEPSAAAALLGGVGLALVALRRRRG